VQWVQGERVEKRPQGGGMAGAQWVSTTHESTSTNLAAHMISWAALFLMIAIVAGILGFGGVAGPAVGIAKILSIVFLILFGLLLVVDRRKRSS